MSAEALARQLTRIAETLDIGEVPPVQLERPRNPEHGDLATNFAMMLAGRVKRPPRELAQWIVDQLDLAPAGVSAVEIAGPGFINFRLASGSVQAELRRIVEAGPDWGRTPAARTRRIQVEFVSANPTGPLHIAHGRGAALGDAIASLLEWAGDSVQREFYVNDSGAQIDRLAESVEARWLELAGETATIPEGGYHGEYLRELAQRLEAEEGARLRSMERTARLSLFRDRAMMLLREEQERDLRAFRVEFDLWFKESRLYREGRLEETLAELEQRGLTYRSEGAVWLRTSDFGDDKDRVLVKSDGSCTYFLPDLAYHRDKARRGFEHVINVWGADHHGYAPRLRSALAALGLRDFVDVEIVQMVRIMRAGVEVKLSKRAGNIVTLRELFEMVGVDVARYFFLMRRSDAQMLFDLELALDHSDKNPVYKVQYAHARMMSIFRKAGLSPEQVPADTDVSPLTHAPELELVKQLARFPETVRKAAEARAPHLICEYLEATAGLVNSWYHAGNPSRNPELAVLVPDPGMRAARLLLARAVHVTLRNGLRLLALDAPERMEREESA